MHPLISYFILPEPNGPADDNGGELNNGPQNIKINKSRVSACIVVALIFFYIIFRFLFASPAKFNAEKVVTIKSGMTTSEIGNYLYDNKIIRSPLIFKIATSLIGGKNGVIAGVYKFDEPMSVFGVVGVITTNGYGSTVLKVTIPEGLSNKQIATLLSKTFDNFDSKKFISLATEKEGYLFPDTYFFEPETTPEKVIDTMTKNFEEKIKQVELKVLFSRKKLHEILTMASILEEEARTEETRKRIADILWRRIDKGMMLQVDASFVYLLGKGSANLSLDDLKIDSPYNTYKYKGLPPGPITNPGINAIVAALEPISNPYWFYLSDKKGNMHYAVTFEEHVANKMKYLR